MTYTETMMDAFKQIRGMVEPTEEFTHLRCLSTTIGYCIATGRVFADDEYDWNEIAEIFPKIKHQDGPAVNASKLVEEINKQWDGTRLVGTEKIMTSTLPSTRP